MPSFACTPRARYSRFTWCTMPTPGRHDFERVEGLHAPFHELVALLVPLEFQFHVEVKRFLAAVVIDLHRVVHDQVHRHQRLDDLRIPAHPGGDAAHGGQVRQQGHAGEVLRARCARPRRGSRRCAARRLPGGQLPDVFFGDFLAVHVAQHRLEHDADAKPADVKSCLYRPSPAQAANRTSPFCRQWVRTPAGC